MMLKVYTKDMDIRYFRSWSDRDGCHYPQNNGFLRSLRCSIFDFLFGLGFLLCLATDLNYYLATWEVYSSSTQFWAKYPHSLRARSSPRVLEVLVRFLSTPSNSSINAAASFSASQICFSTLTIAS